jgi:hypothetical protein
LLPFVYQKQTLPDVCRHGMHAPASQRCPTHSDERRQLYCETCEVSVCPVCALANHNDSSHSLQPVENAIEHHRLSLDSFVASSQAEIDTLLAVKTKSLSRIETLEQLRQQVLLLRGGHYCCVAHQLTLPSPLLLTAPGDCSRLLPAAHLPWQASQRLEQHFVWLARALERRKATVQAQLDRTAETKRKLVQEDIEAYETHVNQRKHGRNTLKVRQIICMMSPRAWSTCNYALWVDL